MDLQQSFWNAWNADNREVSLSEVSRRQASIVVAWLEAAPLRDARILEAGCGTGWLCPLLTQFGEVVGTDLSDTVLGRARQRWPDIRFIAGDFMSLPFTEAAFDVVVSLEVLSHVVDQPRFMERVAALLRPGGALLLATQNRPVLRDHCLVPPPAPGQLRHWVDRAELTALAEPWFEIEELRSVTPIAQRGPRRLLTSARLNALARPLVGHRLRDALEARDWGWTLMLRAARRAGVSPRT